MVIPIQFRGSVPIYGWPTSLATFSVFVGGNNVKLERAGLASCEQI